jgi:hypothetical protein
MSDKEAIDAQFTVVNEHLQQAVDTDGLGGLEPTINTGDDPDRDLQHEPQSDRERERERDTEQEPRALSPFDAASAPIVLPEHTSRSDAIHLLSREIPSNEYGFPLFFYRSDLLPAELELLTQGDLDQAAVRLDYSEGYPTYGAQSSPWWERLPHEPAEPYTAFTKYLDQPEEVGIRQITLLSRDEHLPTNQVVAWAREYYWARRAHVYDAFITAADKKRKEFLQRKVEGQHYRQTQGIISDLMQVFEPDDHGTPWWKRLDPKEALDAVERIMKLQRLSVGLSVNGNAGLVANPIEGFTVAAVMREVTKQGALVAENMDTDLMRAMASAEDPSMIARAQQLIIQLRRGTPPASPGPTGESSQSQPAR